MVLVWIYICLSIPWFHVSSILRFSYLPHPKSSKTGLKEFQTLWNKLISLLIKNEERNTHTSVPPGWCARKCFGSKPITSRTVTLTKEDILFNRTNTFCWYRKLSSSFIYELRQLGNLKIRNSVTYLYMKKIWKQIWLLT